MRQLRYVPSKFFELVGADGYDQMRASYGAKGSYLETVVTNPECTNSLTQLYGAAMTFHEFGGRLREQGAEVGLWQQQIAGGTCAGQAIADNVQEDLRVGLVRVGVEGGDAERIPQTIDERARLAMRMQESGRRQCCFTLESGRLHASHESHGGDFGGNSKASSEADGNGKVQWGR